MDGRISGNHGTGKAISNPPMTDVWPFSVNYFIVQLFLFTEEEFLEYGTIGELAEALGRHAFKPLKTFMLILCNTCRTAL